MKTIKMIISGRVQGVSFRQFIYQNAIKLGLTGYVKNLINGNVEVVISGNKENIKELVEICKIGPINAIVDNIEIKDINSTNLNNFEII